MTLHEKEEDSGAQDGEEEEQYEYDHDDEEEKEQEGKVVRNSNALLEHCQCSID